MHLREQRPRSKKQPRGDLGRVQGKALPRSSGALGPRSQTQGGGPRAEPDSAILAGPFQTEQLRGATRPRVTARTAKPRAARGAPARPRRPPAAAR